MRVLVFHLQFPLHILLTQSYGLVLDEFMLAQIQRVLTLTVVSCFNEDQGHCLQLKHFQIRSSEEDTQVPDVAFENRVIFQTNSHYSKSQFQCFQSRSYKYFFLNLTLPLKVRLSRNEQTSTMDVFAIGRQETYLQPGYPAVQKCLDSGSSFERL